ncbi:hypothetical protein NGM10_03490 [Halorussus salilacus]|uniref:DUF7289 family protein n=1 Tax=Halorussus salilacus TaxID=2953750 RepID=UPI00209F39A8|nr:hypothetical protein [Halorussus salilacus]USZ68805.1 hypothetical protein NGM10_03490 [Halorussus salilacus]
MTSRATSSGAGRGRSSAGRGQSEVLGVVLLLGLTITGTGVIVAFGSSALDDSKQASELDSAEHAMTQLDSKLSLVGVGDSDSQSMSLGVDGHTAVENESGRMVVSINPTEGSEVPETEVMNQSLGAVVYENGGSRVAYQGGGVWRRTDNGTTMVSPPEVHYRDTTLTLPLVAVSGQGPLDGRTVATKNGSSEPMYPVEVEDGEDLRNPLLQAEVNLTVESEYYEAWGRFFEERTGGEATVDHDEESVTLRLVTPPNVPEIEQGIASTSSQELSIQGAGGNPSFTDSYNSSDGDYDSTEGDDGTIETVGGVTMSGGAEIRGDLVSGGGEVEMESSNTEIDGNLSYGGSADLHKKATVGGWTESNGSVSEIDPVDSMVSSRNESIHDDNDNDDADAIDGDRLDCDSTCELSSGSYYLDELDHDGGTLTLDLSEGDIDIAVAGPIAVGGGTIEVENPDDGRVDVYMDSSELAVTDGEVDVPDEKAGSFRIYAPPGLDAEFSSSEFDGMVYAPDSDGRQGEISVTSQAEVFGALVGGQTTLQSGGVVHYDQALARSSTLPEDYETAPYVTYMHVSVNRVNVTAT